MPPIETTPRPRVWTVFVVFALALVGFVIATGVVVTIVLAQKFPDRIEDPTVLVDASKEASTIIGGIAVSLLVLAGVSLLAARLSPVPLRERLRLFRGTFDGRDVAIATLGALAIGDTFSALAELAGWMEGSALDVMAQGVAAMSTPAFVATIVLGSIGPGIGEEFLFRGYMQTRLVRRWGPRVGIVVASLGFGVLHLDPLHASFAFFLGLYLGWLAEVHRTIVLGIIVHALNNAASFALQRALPESAGMAVSLVRFAGGLVVAGLVLRWIARHHPRRDSAST